MSRHQCTREPPLRPINARTTKCSILIRTRLNGGARPDWNVNPPMETKYDNREKKKTNASVRRVANVGSCPLSVTKHTHKKKMFYPQLRTASSTLGRRPRLSSVLRELVRAATRVSTTPLVFRNRQNALGAVGGGADARFERN